MNTYKNFNDLNLREAISNTTIVIDHDIELTSDLVFGENVTIIFEGGMFLAASSNIHITGNNTVISAPPYQIFESDIIVDGTWRVDRAYPQWLGAIGYETANDASAGLSSSEVINKLISIIGTGDIFFIPGFYRLATPIEIPRGISLKGICGNNCYADERSIRTTSAVLMLDFNPMYTYHHIIGVNVKSVNGSYTWASPYAVAYSSIENIQIRNMSPNLQYSSEHQIPIALFLGMGIKLENVLFYNLPRAVKFVDGVYIDMKQIINCVYINDTRIFNLQNEEIKPIAFDLSGLGDSLLFDHNQVDGLHNSCLKLSSCNGGIISNNILNGKVEILNSKGIIFEANHLESYFDAGKNRSAQLGIFNTAITVVGNYFEKGMASSIIIKGNPSKNMSNAVLTNNTFTSRSALNIIGPNGTIGNAQINWMNVISDYDIVISKNANIKISNCFRNWFSIQGSSFSMPTGLRLQVSNNDDELYDETSQTLQDFTDFNDFSYAFSRECKISNGKIMDATFCINNTNPSISHAIQVNANTFWLLPNSKCVYSFEIIWDKTRRIVGNNTTYSLNTDSNTIDVERNSGGVLVRIESGDNNNYLVRVFRKRQELTSACTYLTKYEYVDVPMCGGIFLYDDGISLSGYKWISCNNIGQVTIMPRNTTIQNIRRFGNNVQCNATSNSGLTGWQKRDILFNTGTDSSWQIHIK